jgi:protease-4
VVASFSDVAASGGYYVAAGADRIVAQPATITGSIGVFGGKFSLGGLYEKIGIGKEVLKRGRHADLFDESRPWTDAERAHVHEMMARFYTRFVSKAAEGRKKSYEDIDAVAQGRVWTGAAALDQGLVDRLGGMDVALAVAKERAKIAATQDVELVILPERKGLLETFLERQEEGLETALPRDLRALLRWATLLRDGQPLTRLPFELNVR